MTIPIEPGAFSFLPAFGAAAGAYAEEKEKKRQQSVKEAQDVLNQMIELRSKEFIGHEAFSSPQAMEVYRRLGIMPPDTGATSTETLHQGQGQYLSQLAPQLRQPGGPGDEARAGFGLPERGLTEKVDAGIAENRATTQIAPTKVPVAQLGAAQATAQMPEAGSTAVAGQQGIQDELFNGIADRVVETLYSKTKKLPTPEQAFNSGLSDTRAQSFGERINAQYYGAAVERLRAKLSAESIARQNANARAQGASGTGLDDYYKIAQNQQARITAEMNSLKDPDKPGDIDFTKHDIVQDMIAKKKPVPQLLQQSYKRVVEYQQKLKTVEKRRRELEQEMQQTRNSLSSQLGGTLGAPPPHVPGTEGSPQQDAAAREYEQRTKGVTDPARRKRVADEIAHKYGIKLGGQ